MQGAAADTSLLVLGRRDPGALSACPVRIWLRDRLLSGQGRTEEIDGGLPRVTVGLRRRPTLAALRGLPTGWGRRLTQTAMDQLAQITLYILRVDEHRVNFTFDNVRESVLFIAKLFLNVPDQPFASTHSAYLGPYYSSTSVTSLRSKLTDLVNALTEDDVDTAVGENVTSNLADWSEKLAQTQKELLLLAVEQRSHFTFDMITWIVGVTEILLAAANGPAAREYEKKKLRENALRLIYTLSWLPKDKQSATFLETFRVVERLADHLAGGDVEGGEQRCRAVALVVVATTRSLAGPHR
jgi:hypothetical protein